MRLRTSWGYSGPSGTAGGDQDTVGGSAVLARLIRDDVRRAAPSARDVGEAFIRVLRGRRSRWPSAGRTGNLGPYASGRSVEMFRQQQGRSATGQFEGVQLVNDAVNPYDGRLYAADVDQGLKSDGRPVSSSRFEPNFRAIAKTWTENLSTILSTAGNIRGRRGR